MKVGDYVLVGDDAWAGVITQLDFHPKTHLVWRLDNTSPMALLRHERELTPLDPAVSDILTAVNTNERE
jgi:hypothetical protein